MITAGEAISRNVVRAGALDRIHAYATEIADRKATHCVIFEGEKLRGVVRMRDVATISPLRILSDLSSPCAEVDAQMPLVEIADEFLNPDTDAFVVMNGGHYVGLLTRESLLERLLSEQRAISVEREQAVAAKQEAAHLLETQIAAKTEHLARANREIELLTYSLSHNLKAPLRHILLFGEIVAAERERLSEEAQRALSRIAAAADLGLLIVDSARLLGEASHRSLKLSPVQLTAVFDKILEQYESRREAKQIRLLVAQPLPVVVAHFESLYQVIGNLVENAFKFTPSTDGIVVIRVETRGEVARIWVIDNGSGVPPQDRETIFQAFQRGSNVDGIAGSGIGLAFSRACMRQMNGAIGVESAPDEGSRFWIELPLDPASSNLRSQATEAPTP
jgi:signal transduction histidine kinase